MSKPVVWYSWGCTESVNLLKCKIWVVKNNGFRDPRAIFQDFPRLVQSHPCLTGNNVLKLYGYSFTAFRNLVFVFVLQTIHAIVDIYGIVEAVGITSSAVVSTENIKPPSISSSSEEESDREVRLAFY